MKIAVAQLSSSENKNENLLKAEKYIIKAKNAQADFIVFPEHYMASFTSPKVNRSEVSEKVDGPFVTELCRMAKENNIYILCGIYEYAENESFRSYNSVVTINREGEVVDCYRKNYLYDAFSAKESDTSVLGSAPPKVINTEFGKIGVIICYELRFPEITRYLTSKGAEFIFIPTAWKDGILKEHHWRTLLQARAIENTVFIIGADQIDNNNVGNSMIIDPMGTPIAQAGEEEALIVSEINTNRLKTVRKKLPSLEHTKPASFYES